MDRVDVDIVDRLRRDIDPSIWEYEFARRGEREEAASEIERLRAAWLALIQADNECEPLKRGAPCYENCACRLEMQAHIDTAYEQLEEQK